jgi:sigma-B regulation protein RsbU (phosphoserine phosphatase)
VAPGEIPCAARRILQPGQMVLFLTDGIEEAVSPEGETFGIERTLEVVRANRGRRACDIVAAIYQAARSFTREMPQHDDITAVVLKVEE